MAGAGYDYVIIGGGSAGCVLASRLSEDAAARVLLLEAGGRDDHPLVHMPIGFARMTDGPYTWGLKTVPQTHACGRAIPYAQGKILGGGSSINAEVYTRGHPSDFDRWAEEEDCPGWSFAEVKPYFLRSEGNTILAGDWHGTDGPLAVSNNANPQPMTRAFVQSCQEYGIPYSADFNGPAQAGAGVYQLTVKDGRRCSAAKGYLRPALKRDNLTVVTDALVKRIVVRKGRAVAVEYWDDMGAKVVAADGEILLVAGAVGSPKLMMLSGMGPAEHLRGHGIEVVNDLPGVGENLNDHYGVDIVAELTGHYSLDKYNTWYWAGWAGLQYLMYRSGPLASNVVEGGAFWFANGRGEVPDLQFHFLAGAGAEAGVPSVPKGTSGITLNSYALRPKSRGTVRLKSSDPLDAPIVDPNFLAEPDDLKVSVEGVRISREIFRQPSLRKVVRTIHYPDDGVATDADLEAYARRYGRTSYHPVGTCRMGTDGGAVVDPSLRVHGIEGLRICDGSIMPSLVGSNTNAAVVMIGEKASDLVRGNR